MGNVAATAHQSGSVKSATSPNPAKVSQNIFFCMPPAYFERRTLSVGVPNRYLAYQKQKKGGTRLSSRPAFSIN
jgi:hypothetical protein